MIFSLKHLLIGRQGKHLLMGRYRRMLTNNKRYRRTVNIIGWVLFFASALLYLLTLYPTLSFWDSGEFIFTSRSLQTGHQPGAPLYQLIALLISHLSFGNEKLVAPLINSVSALASAFSIMLLFHIFLYLFNKYSERYVGNIAAAFIASCIFALTDSFWTSSTESEVYTLSFLFTVLCIRIILQWDENPKEKYIVLLCFLLGLSFCVHPLTLLILPAVIVIIYFHYKRISFKRLFFVFLISCLALFVFTNFLSILLLLLSFSSFLTLLLFLLLLSVLFFVSYLKNRPLLNTLAFCLLFFVIGLSPYGVTLIRGKASLPLNEYGVKDAKELRLYVSRSAYIDAPLVYGPYYTALPPKDFEIKNKHLSPVFDKELCTFFPRMWNYTAPSLEDGYISWTGQAEKTVMIDGLEREKPSFKQNLMFFVNYQTYYMYLR
ncbi:MAG: DUF2723 domain-containing protein, partial [Bacteroidales bacterium]|nr:DUF2723 domain-containing protein [Bacteroidales bacterium]